MITVPINQNMYQAVIQQASGSGGGETQLQVLGAPLHLTTGPNGQITGLVQTKIEPGTTPATSTQMQMPPISQLVQTKIEPGTVPTTPSHPAITTTVRPGGGGSGLTITPVMPQSPQQQLTAGHQVTTSNGQVLQVQPKR